MFGVEADMGQGYRKHSSKSQDAVVAHTENLFFL